MKILGIESSQSTASLAVIDDETLIGEYTINNTLKHSKTLMPMLEEMMNRLDLSMKEIDLIAISAGPGSFTGLRIGSATAKGLAHAMNIRIAEVPTMQVMAAGVRIPSARVGVVLYARAREIYYNSYKIEEKNGSFYPTESESIQAMEVEELIEQLSNQNAGIDYIVGDGLLKFPEEFKKVAKDITCLKPMEWGLSAKRVAHLGKIINDENKTVHYSEHKPYYFKKSQAEREYDAKRQDD